MMLKVMLVERKKKERSQIGYVIVQCICLKALGKKSCYMS